MYGAEPAETLHQAACQLPFGAVGTAAADQHRQQFDVAAIFVNNLFHGPILLPEVIC